MPDIEIVKEGLKTCCNDRMRCEGKCPYESIKRFPKCMNTLMKDALAMLKEQQKRIDVLENVRDILTKKINYHNCNTCKAECEIRPLPGEYVRTNCMLWTGEESSFD